MKKILIIMIIAAALLSVQSLSAEGPKIEKAIIAYKVTSTDQEYMGNGTMEIAYDNFGKYMATTSITGEMNVTTIISPEGDYMINWNDKTGMDLSAFGDMKEDGFDFEKDDEGEKIGTETILGKNCEIRLYKDEYGWEKLWLWQGVPLKVVSDSEGIVTTMEATAVSTPASIPPSKFKVPAGIEILKMPGLN